MRLGLWIIPLFVLVGLPARSTSEEPLYPPEADAHRLHGLVAGVASPRAAMLKRMSRWRKLNPLPFIRDLAEKEEDWAIWLSSGGIVKPEPKKEKVLSSTRAHPDAR